MKPSRFLFLLLPLAAATIPAMAQNYFTIVNNTQANVDVWLNEQNKNTGWTNAFCVRMASGSRRYEHTDNNFAYINLFTVVNSGAALPAGGTGAWAYINPTIDAPVVKHNLPASWIQNGYLVANEPVMYVYFNKRWGRYSLSSVDNPPQ